MKHQWACIEDYAQRSALQDNHDEEPALRRIATQRRQILHLAFIVNKNVKGIEEAIVTTCWTGCSALPHLEAEQGLVCQFETWTKVDGIFHRDSRM